MCYMMNAFGNCVYKLGRSRCRGMNMCALLVSVRHTIHNIESPSREAVGTLGRALCVSWMTPVHVASIYTFWHNARVRAICDLNCGSP